MNKNNEQAKVLTDKEIEGVSGGRVVIGRGAEVALKATLAETTMMKDSYEMLAAMKFGCGVVQSTVFGQALG